MTTTALKNCVCKIPRPRITPGRERECVVCGFHIPTEWDSENIVETFDRLERGFAAGPSESFRSMRGLCEAREQDGRSHFGWRFHGRDLIRDIKEELADAQVYLALLIIMCHKVGDEETADAVLNVMMAVYQAWEALHAVLPA